MSPRAHDVTTRNLVAAVADNAADIAEALAGEAGLSDLSTANLVDAITDNAEEIAGVLQEFVTVVPAVSSTVALDDSGLPINTTGKYQGKLAFNTTTNILVVAVGAAAGDLWKNAGTGATAHTPS